MKSGKKLGKEKSSLGSPHEVSEVGSFRKYRKYIQPTYIPPKNVGKKLMSSTSMNAMTVNSTIRNTGIHCTLINSNSIC